MGFPFIAMYGAVSQNQTLLQLAYDQCRLYRNALLVNTPNGNLWAHIFNDDTGQFDDAGTWATGANLIDLLSCLTHYLKFFQGMRGQLWA